jgi:hypothetical protein
MMILSEIIDEIEAEMVCANRCPQWNKAPYDRTKCRCYKRECVEVIEQAVIDIDNLRAEIERKEKENENLLRKIKNTLLDVDTINELKGKNDGTKH